MSNLSKTVLEELQPLLDSTASPAPGWGKVRPRVEAVVQVAASDEVKKPRSKKAAAKK